MNIALVAAAYDGVGLAEQCVEAAVAANAARGAVLTIISRQFSADSQETNVVPRHVLLAPRFFTSTGRDRGFANAVEQHLATTRYDLVQSYEPIEGCDIFRAGDGVHAEWLTQRTRVMDGLKRLGVRLSRHHRYLLQAERAMFNSPTLRAVICHSAMVKADIQRHFAIEEQKLRVILPGVDAQKFHPGLRDAFRQDIRQQLRIPKAAPVALFVGSGFERKGLAGFLLGLADQAGYAALTRDAIRGIVVGHDKHLVRYQSLADQLGLNDRVVFTGGVDDVRPYYAAADIFVSPALYDPLPNACLEAMACGLPIITSTTSGVAELITNGVEGFVTDALETPAISDAIGHTLADAGMGARARERVAALTPAAMVAAYAGLYRELLGLPTEPAPHQQ